MSGPDVPIGSPLLLSGFLSDFISEIGRGHRDQANFRPVIQAVENFQKLLLQQIIDGIGRPAAEKVDGHIGKQPEKNGNRHIADGTSLIEIIGDTPLRNSGHSGESPLGAGPLIGFTKSCQNIRLHHIFPLTFNPFVLKISRKGFFSTFFLKITRYAIEIISRAIIFIAD
ncbi:hypothetical protein [Victivallis vadensis]|uniref:hypothetical protein n=1 Tax=Victivallis vadensis TaxID=172901 RepID=UPI003AF40CD7